MCKNALYHFLLLGIRRKRWYRPGVPLMLLIVLGVIVAGWINGRSLVSSLLRVGVSSDISLS